MNKTQISEATREVGKMLKAFPSSQSNISPETVEAYVIAIEDFELEAVTLACKAFIKGTVKNRNASFAPSAPELANECRAHQDALSWDRHQKTHDFIEFGSETWRKIEISTGRTFPIREMTVNGVAMKGWDMPKDLVSEAKLVPLPANVSFMVSAPKMNKIDGND